MRKKVNKLRHLSILFLTIIIFTLGVLIGGDVEQLRVQNIYTQLQEQDVEFAGLVTQGAYIDYLVSSKVSGSNVSCDIIKGAYYKSIVELDNSRIKLENYINKGSVEEDDFYRLKTHYSNVQISYWMLAEKINNLCDANMNPVLYFYAEDKKCPTCDDQGVHLSYVKQKLGDDVLVFSLDAERGGAIGLIAQSYDVYSRELPVIVVNEEIYGFSTNEELFNILCEQGLENNEICE